MSSPVIGEEGVAPSVTVEPTQRAGRLLAADGLRGLAAFAIIAHHASFATGRTFDPGLLASINARLDVGVPIFFGLSGFLLFEPYVRSIIEGRDRQSSARFWRRRLVRIVPAYWAALTIQLLVGAVAVVGVKGFLLSYTLTHVYVGVYTVSGITQSWSLATELGFYLVLPLFVIVCSRVGRGRPPGERAVLIALACSSWIAISMGTRAMQYGFDLGWSNYRYTVFANGDYFATGMIFGALSAGARHSDAIADGLRQAFRWPGLWYLAAAVVLWVTATQIDAPRGLDEGGGRVELTRQFGYFLVAAGTVGPACCAAARTWSSRFLGCRPLVFLGATSYGVYLWHQVFLSAPYAREGWLFAWVDGWVPFEAPFLPVLGLATIGAIGFGAASWYLLERPLLERFR